MVKQKFFDMKNVVTSLKGISVSIVTSIVIVLFLVATRYFQKTLEMPMVALVFGLVTIVLYLLSWGYFAKLFWGWK